MDGTEDDDFGELYADVELQASSGIGAVTTFGQVPPTSAGELVSSGAKSSVSSLGESTQSDDGDDCESEDDLNIVLNDDNGKVVLRDGTGGGLADEENGGNGDDHDAFKVLSGLALHSKMSGSIGVPSEDIGDDCSKDISYTSRVRAPISSFAPQSGYNFSLPRYSSIFHVNIDAFKEKPWRHPGADVTDFFNFGLDEESWKSYCNSLELLRQRTCLHTRVPDFKHSKVFENGMNHDRLVKGDTADGMTQASMQGIVSNSKEFLESEASKFTVKQGRAIEVEVSIGERLPSTILRRARSPDSDVVIEIPLQDYPEEFSCSRNTVVECWQDRAPESSENGDVDAEKKAIPQDCLEGKAKRSKELSNPERYSRKKIVSKLNSTDHDKHNISNLDDDHGCFSLENPKGNVKTPESVNISGGGHRGPSVVDMWLMENEACPVESTKLNTSSSLFESDFEASNDCMSVDHGKDQSHKIRPPQNDKSENSLASRCKNFVNHRAKQTRGGNYRRQRTPNQEEKYRNRRTRNSFKYKVMDDDVASPTSDYGGLSDSEYWQIDYNRWSERQLFIERNNDELSSYYTGKKVHDGETLTDNTLDVYRGFSSRKGEPILRDGMDLCIKKHGDEHEIDSRRRGSTGEENWEGDCYSQLQRKDAGRRDSFTYGDSIHYILQHCSDTSTEADSLQRTNSEDITLEGEHSQHGGYGYDNDVMQCKYRRHWLLMESNRGSLERNYRREVSTSTKVNRSGKGEVYKGGGPSIEDGLWYNNFEDDNPDFTDWDTFSYKPLRGAHKIERKWHDLMPRRDGSYDTQLSRRRHKRPCYVDESKDSGSPGAYNEVDGTGNFHFPKDQCQLRKRRNNSKSEVQHLTKDESFTRHQDDELRLEEVSVYYRRSLRCGTNQFKNFASEGISEKNMLAKPDLHKMMREQSGAFNVSRGFHVIDKIKSDQAIPNSRVSVDIFFREGKLSRSDKGQKIMYNATPESEDLKVVKRETFESLKTEIHQEDDNRKWIDKFPIAEGNEYSEEIKEGQIVVEEPVAEPEPTRKKVSGSRRTAKKNEGSDGFNDKGLPSKKNEGSDGFDDKRLLETLAKMQKRKERFKEPITCSKEPEVKTGNQVGSRAETAETRVERPARKRRWGGV